MPTYLDQYAHWGYLPYNETAVRERKCNAMMTVDLNEKPQRTEDVESAREKEAWERL